jgi:hypothetical protein
VVALSGHTGERAGGDGVAGGGSEDGLLCWGEVRGGLGSVGLELGYRAVEQVAGLLDGEDCLGWIKRHALLLK